MRNDLPTDGVAPVWLLVCGERMREDDGVADAAVERLPADILRLARVEHIGVLSVEALLEVPSECGIVVADAAGGAAPGLVVRVPLEEIRREGPFPSTTHVTPPDEIVAAAAALSGRSLRGVFVGVGGAEFGFGEELSPAVQAALPAYVRALADAIREQAAWTGGRVG